MCPPVCEYSSVVVINAVVFVHVVCHNSCVFDDKVFDDEVFDDKVFDDWSIENPIGDKNIYLSVNY